MDPDKRGMITRLLETVRDGDPEARDAFMHIVYDELRELARRAMEGVPPADTLQPTALVNEAYLRLVGRGGTDWQNARHFFALAARAMHDIVVEQARKHAAQKRGGGRRRVPLDSRAIDTVSQAPDLLALSEAVERLRVDNSLTADVVMLRFFGGLSYEQTARALDIPLIRARREWAYARAILHRALCPQE